MSAQSIISLYKNMLVLFHPECAGKAAGALCSALWLPVTVPGPARLIRHRSLGCPLNRFNGCRLPIQNAITTGTYL